MTRTLGSPARNSARPSFWLRRVLSSLYNATLIWCGPGGRAKVRRMGEASSPYVPARLKLTNTWRSARITSVSSLDFVTIATVNWVTADFREASEGPGSDEETFAGTAARAVSGPETTGKGIGSETWAVFRCALRETGGA